MVKLNKQVVIIVTIVFALSLANFSYIVVGSFLDEESQNNTFDMIDGIPPIDISKIREKKYVLKTNINVQGNSLPSQWDWRDTCFYEISSSDWTTSIKNQAPNCWWNPWASCGSCWAFATMGALESIINIKEGRPYLNIDLSEQYLLSCPPYSGGCNGWRPDLAYEYLQENGGGIPESCFLYQADDSIPCSYKCSNWQDNLIPISDYGPVCNPSRGYLKQLLVEHGPFVAYMAVYRDFTSYSGGIYNHSGYESWNDINHAIVVVGYNDDPGYWICKNSWGTGWGENGWFKIVYGDCQIESSIIWVDYKKGSANFSPLRAYTDKSIYAPDENISITIQNKGCNALSLYLKKWYIEKKIIDGVWETIYESSKFSDQYSSAIPIDDTIAIPINDTFGTIPYNPITPYKPNGTVGIWTNSEVIETNNNLITSEGLAFVQGENSTYTTQPTILLSDQKKIWTWCQITSDGKKPGSGNYRVKVAYDDTYVTSSLFSITTGFFFSEEPIIWKPSNNLTTNVSLEKINVNENPSFINLSSSTPTIETVVDRELKPLAVKIMVASNGETSIEVNNITATTTNSVMVNNSRLLLLTTSGYKNVEVLPDMVQEKAGMKSIKTIVLKEFDNKSLYQINGVRESNLLWFIPVDMDVTVHLNAETGSVEDMEKPWWGFLAS